MKEQMCHVAYDYQMESKSRDDCLNQEQRSYELPGNKIIEVDMKKRINASEIIFSPQYSSHEAQQS